MPETIVEHRLFRNMPFEYKTIGFPTAYSSNSVQKIVVNFTILNFSPIEYISNEKNKQIEYIYVFGAEIIIKVLFSSSFLNK